MLSSFINIRGGNNNIFCNGGQTTSWCDSRKWHVLPDRACILRETKWISDSLWEPYQVCGYIGQNYVTMLDSSIRNHRKPNRKEMLKRLSRYLLVNEPIFSHQGCLASADSQRWIYLFLKMFFLDIWIELMPEFTTFVNFCMTGVLRESIMVRGCFSSLKIVEIHELCQLCSMLMIHWNST